MTGEPILRVARPTDDIKALLPFYREGLGLSLLYRFARRDRLRWPAVRLALDGPSLHRGLRARPAEN